MPGCIYVARPQVTDQKLLSAKHIKRKETVMIVITMKKSAFLFAVHRIVRGIKIQYQLFRSLLERGDKLFYQQSRYPNGCLTIRAVLPSTQSRGAGQILVRFNCCL